MKGVNVGFNPGHQNFAQLGFKLIYSHGVKRFYSDRNGNVFKVAKKKHSLAVYPKVGLVKNVLHQNGSRFCLGGLKFQGGVFCYCMNPVKKTGLSSNILTHPIATPICTTPTTPQYKSASPLGSQIRHLGLTTPLGVSFGVQGFRLTFSPCLEPVLWILSQTRSRSERSEHQGHVLYYEWESDFTIYKGKNHTTLSKEA